MKPLPGAVPRRGFPRWARAALVAALSLGLFPGLRPRAAQLAAAPPSSPSLRARQEAQEKAREIARDLVSGILDTQLAQLEENGLTALPIYREIRMMRDNLAGLVRLEMSRAIDLLVEAQAVEEPRRGEVLEEVRKTIREVILGLSLERHNLLRRLRTSDLAAQTRRVIDVESQAIERTGTLPGLPKAAQEAAALSAVQDQVDVRLLFHRLVEALEEVSRWGGSVALGAADGLRILKAARVAAEIDEARSRLAAGLFTRAAESQRQVIKGLRLLLEKIEETQGLLGSDRGAALELTEELARREEALLEKVEREDLSSTAGEKLVELQLGIHKAMGKLEEGLDGMPETLERLNRARALALEAGAKVFEADRQGARDRGAHVVAELTAMAQDLRRAREAESAARSAAELEQAASDLTRAEKLLEEAQGEHDRAEKTPRPDEAASLEGRAADRAREASAVEQLPGGLQARIADAADRAALARDVLRRPEAEDAERSRKLSQAGEALELALAETRALARDTERRALAARVGELSRAAEAVERAAGATRELEASPREGHTAEETRSPEQASGIEEEVRRVAAKVAEGTRRLAPGAAARLERESTQHPGPRSAELSEAARELRSEAGEAAGELEKVSDAALAEVAPVRTALESMSRGDAPGEDLETRRLEQAGARASLAAVEAARAGGHLREAELLGRAGNVESARRAAVEAASQVEELALGRGSGALDAAAAEQKASDLAAQAGESLQTLAPPAAGATPGRQEEDPVARARAGVAEAVEASSQAARALVDGRASEALELARRSVRSLESARNELESEGLRAGRKPEGQTNSGAAEAARVLLAEAAGLSREGAPRGSKAFSAAESAIPRIEDSPPSPPAPTRESPGDFGPGAQPVAPPGGASPPGGAAPGPGPSSSPGNLNDEAQLQAARESLAEGQALVRDALTARARLDLEAAVAEGERARELSPAAARVDPGTGAALRSAAHAAREAALSAAQGESPRAQEALRIRRNIERALANLSAREERIRRDRGAALLLSRASSRQASAAAALEQARALLEAEPRPPPAEPPRQAALDLRQALEEFADAQTELGEGAEQVVEQKAIANAPLREALEIASRLPVPGQTAPSPGEEGGPPGGLAGAPGSPGAQESSPGSRGGAPGTGAGQPSMGSDFVPRAPAATARGIAGRRALAAAERAGVRLPGEAPRPGEGQPSEGNSPGEGGEGGSPGQGEQVAGGGSPAAQGQSSPGDSSAPGSGAASGKGSTEPGAAGAESPPVGARGQTAARGVGAGAREQGAGAPGVGPRDEPWLLRLPPATREAIRAQSRKPPPRAFEERLKRYFDGLE